MGIFPSFGDWIDQIIEQRLTEAESNSSENVKSKSASSKITREERDDIKEQLKLWRDSEKEEPWHDEAEPKVKVHKVQGYTNLDFRFTIGLPPQVAYDLLTNLKNQPYARNIEIRGLLENKSREFVKRYDDGDETWMVEKDVPLFWNLLTVPMRLEVVSARPLLLGTFVTAKKVMFLERFTGDWKVKPIYVDSERLCMDTEPKTTKEYIKCSDGQGKIASKVRIGFLFLPDFPFNLPPFIWCIRRIIRKTAKTLIQDFQGLAAEIRRV